jgi:hypothetical protein
MSGDMIPPSPGMSSSEDSPAVVPDRRSETPGPRSGVPNPNLGAGTTSADDLGLSLGQANPDPFLGEFEPEASAVVFSTPPTRALPAALAQVLAALDLDVPPSAEAPAIADGPSGVSAVVAALNLAPTARTTAAPAGNMAATKRDVAPSSSSASKLFAAVDLYGPSPSKPQAVGPTRTTNNPDENRYHDEDEELPRRGSSWFQVFLLSYASAVTLGLIWVLWGHRTARESANDEADPFPSVEVAAEADPGHRAGQSRKVVPTQPLPSDRVVSLGQSLRFDSLEVTPLGVSSGSVILRHEINPLERRRGGAGALMLTIRLRNLSSDSILVPLDEAFIRERGRGIHDSFIETSPTTQIDMFPLAIVSEWSILGQEYRALRPGESYETLVVSAPGAVDLLVPEMTWRLRLRTDVNQTKLIGVRFKERDIRRFPEQESDDPEGEEKPAGQDPLRAWPAPARIPGC